MKNTEHAYDLVVVGTGIGGATLVNALAPSGARILVLERGENLQDSPQARDSKAIFAEQRFKSAEQWRDGNGQLFSPGNYYYLGGNSKFYGAVMLRYREQDFTAMTFADGVSPAWPFSYRELAPFYQRAEALYQVRGTTGQDSCDPSGERGYVAEAVTDEPSIAKLRQRLEKVGVRPFSLPLALDIERWLDRAQTPWDAYPDTGSGKMDAQAAALQPALNHDNVTLLTGAKVLRLHASGDGKKIESVEIRRNAVVQKISAPLIVLSAGAVNSAAILLASRCKKFPGGLANSSDQLGRNFMNHNCTALLAINPFKRNTAVYQKTLGINDFYLQGDAGEGPLGNIQLLGKIDGVILKAGLPKLLRWMPRFALDWLARHSVDWYVMSEDLADAQSRVTVDENGQIKLDWQRTNMSAHKSLLKKAKQVMRAAGYPILLSQAFDRRTPSHQCGTVRIGNDPASAPLDPYCRSYDQRNLFVVDGSFLPTSAAVNPALTIAAQALRVAEHIKITENF